MTHALRSRSLRLLALLLGVALFAAACGDSDDSGSGSDGSDTITAADLDGRAFWSQRVVDAGEDRTLVDGTRIQISFTDGSVGATAGCNSMGGSYLLDGDTLVVDGLAMTEIGCDADRHDQDQFVADFLVARPTVTLDGNLLTLEVGDSLIELLDREVANPDVAIVGTRWVADGFIDGDAAMAFEIGERGWLEFSDQSTMIGFDGCRELSAPVEVSEGDVGGPVEGDGEVQFGEVTSTGDGDCDFPDYQKAFFALFSTGEATLTVTGTNMTALNRDGRGVTFIAE